LHLFDSICVSVAAACSHVWAAGPCALLVLCYRNSCWLVAKACGGTDEFACISFPVDLSFVIDVGGSCCLHWVWLCMFS